MSGLDEFIEECLREHNAKRAHHSATLLKHSRALDKTAQDWAEALISEEKIKNSPASGRGEIGESISMRTSLSGHVDLQGSEVVAQWYADAKNYNFEEGQGPAGNFTQLVWKGTREVGFGKACANGKCIVVAHYRPPGNVRGHYVENVGKPIDGKLPEGPADPMGDPAAKRSVVTETVTNADGKKVTVQREVVESTGADGKPDGATAGQLNSFAVSVTEAHNAYRKKHGSGELKLDPELSKLAQNWANHLVNQAHLSNSGATFQGIRVGENVFSRWSTGSAKVTGQEVVDHWYQENSKYKFHSEPDSIKGIGSFTQMIWQGSQQIGVGLATQPKKDVSGADSNANAKIIVVCMYYPPGNVTGQFTSNVKRATS